MGVEYMLVNVTRREYVRFRHLPVSKAAEIIGNPVASTLVTYYLFRSLGDQIAFVSDVNAEWPFPGSRADLDAYAEITDVIINEMLGFGWLTEGERMIWDDDDPTIYTRSLTPTWLTHGRCWVPYPPWGMANPRPVAGDGPGAESSDRR